MNSSDVLLRLYAIVRMSLSHIFDDDDDDDLDGRVTELKTGSGCNISHKLLNHHRDVICAI